jgi:DNA-binding transcriptional LysR family regulator
MVGIAMMRNEIRLMEAAIALAEELNFSRAAHRLHISQPALTKQIAELESRLGFSLFERDHQSVAVNEAGRAYVQEARMSVFHSERAVQAARAALNNAEVVLRVGRSPYGDPFLTSTLLSVRLPLFPQLKVELTSGFSCDLVHDVLSGRVDLALVTEPPESPMLSMTKVDEAPLYVALSEENELAKLPQLSMSNLSHQNWIIFGRSVHPPLYDRILQVASDLAIRPRDMHHIMVPEEAYQLIAEKNGVALLSKTGALKNARDGVTIRPLVEQGLILKTFLASRVDNQSKLTSEIVRAFGRKMRMLDGDPQLNLPISA